MPLHLTLTPFLSDALSIGAFYFLVTKGHANLARQVCDRVDTILPQRLGGRRAEIETFMAESFEVVDMHRRMNLVALVSIGGTLAIHESGIQALPSLAVAWAILYYVTTQIAPPVADVSRQKLKSNKKNIARLFSLWIGISIILKIIAMNNPAQATDKCR